MKKTLVFICALMFVNVCFAEKSPKSLAIDSRIKVVNFDENNVVKVMGHDLIQTSIQFHPNESILDVSSGDSLAWQWNIAAGRNNILFIKPMLQDSDTNMKVITNKRIYEFRLVSSGYYDNPNDVTYRLSFKYPEEERAKSQKKLLAHVKKAEFSQAPANNKRWNYYYSFTGNKRLAPVQAFDDDKGFTYFQFSEGAPIPAIYAVDANRKEQLVNYRIQEPYVVVEKISGQFTLRDGGLVATIINEKFVTKAKA